MSIDLMLWAEDSFQATRHTGETFTIDAAYVDTRLSGIAGGSGSGNG